MGSDDTRPDKTKPNFADLMRQVMRRPGDEASPPAPVKDGTASPPDSAQPSAAGDVADFVSKMKAMAPATVDGRGRLMFAMDATMSRQPTWDMALQLQGEMFDAVAEIGGLDVQLVYYRGYGECRHSRWVSDPKSLARLMTQVDCRGGLTQIGKVLKHGRDACAEKRINAIVLVGDAFEEDVDQVCAMAGELGLLGVPVFAFQEGHNRQAEMAFREIARLTHGAWCRFDAGAAAQLRELLRAVAVYAAGGQAALRKLVAQSGGGQGGAQLLLEQLDKRS